MKNNKNLSKWEYFLKLKKEYLALKANDDFESQKLEIELRLWNLLTQMSNDEILELSEKDRNWSKSFIESKKKEFFFQELERQKRNPIDIHSPQDVLGGLQRAFQHAFSPKELKEGPFRQISKRQTDLISNGTCPTCLGTFTTEQINQYLANHAITCDHYNTTVRMEIQINPDDARILDDLRTKLGFGTDLYILGLKKDNQG